MKTIHFTNNDLAEAMGLEVGKKYKDELENVWECAVSKDITKIDIVMLRFEGIVAHEKFISRFVGEKLTLIEPKPQLTEQEITILKGRLAEGHKTIGRDERYILFDDFVATDYVDTLFTFIKNSEEYSIEELLKGAE